MKSALKSLLKKDLQRLSKPEQKIASVKRLPTPRRIREFQRRLYYEAKPRGARLVVKGVGSRVRKNRMHGLTKGRWKPLSAVVRGRLVRRNVREWFQVSASALLYPHLFPFSVPNGNFLFKIRTVLYDYVLMVSLCDNACY